MNYTKGPWHLIETKNIRNPDCSAYLLANLSPEIHGILDSVNKIDAHLIASAPDLLEALEAINEAYKKGHGLNDKVLNQMKLALNKANGK